jgi:hypothetical protein
MNKTSTAETYDVMVDFLSRSRFSDHTGVLVQMVARTPRRVFWKPFAPKGRAPRNNMMIMNARVFYAFATDPEKRVPGVDVQPTEDLKGWESWTALDFMLEEFWSELERQTRFVTPNWIREIARQTL